MRRLCIRTAAGILAAALVLAGCGGGAGGGPSGPDTVNAFNLTSFVTRPVKNTAPQSAPINHTQYTGSVAWQTQDSAPVTANFAASTVYKAVVTLAAKPGWTFDGVAAGSFTYAGATSVTNTSGGTTVTVTITFPATTGVNDPDTVSALNLTNLVTAPVKNATPNTSGINTAQYTGTIVWQTQGGAAHSGAFAASTVYKAVVTLNAQTGWTFDGMAAGSFSYAGATSVTNTSGGTTVTVTITFPATEAGGDIPGETTGTLTIQNVPAGTEAFSAYITTQTITANYTSIITNFTAVGAVTGSQSGTVEVLLYTTAGGTTGFTGAGTYSILVLGTGGGAATPLVKAVNGKSFSNGSAAITWADLEDVSGMGGNGVLTVRDIPEETGAFMVYILRDEVTEDSYLTAMTSYAAWGTATGSSGGTKAVPLHTFGGLAAFGDTGEYSILVYDATSLLAKALNYMEFINGGAEISWNDLEEVSGMSGGPAFLELTDNVWYGNALAVAGQVHEYQFYAERNKSYYVSWNDYYNGYNSALARVKVSAERKSSGESIFTGKISGYSSPELISADKSGYIKVTVELAADSWGEFFSGPYSLIYWENTGDTALQFNFTISGGDMGVSGGIKLDKSEDNSITLSVGNAESYTDFRWILEGEEITDETNGSITLSASAYAAGIYHLTAVAYKDGVPYSGEITFAVVE
jgi:hypothetical protein